MCGETSRLNYNMKPILFQYQGKMKDLETRLLVVFEGFSFLTDEFLIFLIFKHILLFK